MKKITEFIVKGLIRCAYFVGKKKGKIRGLGRLQSFLRHDFEFEAFGKKFYFNHEIDGSYKLLLIGISNEPETPILLEKIFTALPEASFVDVGASIGEMVMFASKFDSVSTIYAVEPRRDVLKSLHKTVALNNEKRIHIVAGAVGDVHGQKKYFFTDKTGTASSIIHKAEHTASYEVESVQLDKVLPSRMPTPVVLIDIEGAELIAMKGMIDFINNNLPLIMFEHHSETKKVFSLDEVKKMLPDHYDFWRIKSDGKLDKDFSASWNIAAIPAGSPFEKILEPMMNAD